MLFLPREEGQGLLEYGLVIILLAIVVVLILLVLGPAMGKLFSTIKDALPYK